MRGSTQSQGQKSVFRAAEMKPDLWVHTFAVSRHNCFDAYEQIEAAILFRHIIINPSS